MTSEEYGQYIDDFELGADVIPGESLTEYIKRRQQEFESKANGGRIGFKNGTEYPDYSDNMFLKLVDKISPLFIDEDGDYRVGLQKAKFALSKFIAGKGTDLVTGAEWYNKLDDETQNEIIEEKIKYRERGELGGVPLYDEEFAGRYGIGGNYADGGSIGIEVLFGPKREDFNIGGIAQRKVPYDPRASAQDFAKALGSVSAGTTYQQQADAKRYARQQADEMLRSAMKSADPSKGPGLQGIYDTFFKGKNTGISPTTFSPGGSGRMISYSSQDRDRILDQMANQMLNTTQYSQSKVNQRREKEYADFMNNLIASTYGKADDYRAEAMTLGMPTEAYFDYLVTSDPKDKLSTRDVLSRDPYFDPKTYVPTDYSNPETPRPPSPYEVYFQQELQNQISAGIPVGQRIQRGQVLGLPTLAGPGSQMGPGYESYADVVARNKKMMGLKDGGRVGMVSGGALKGIMSLFKGGDKAADLAKQEEIFRSGNITADFLENVNPKVTEKFIRTRDTGGVGGYGMYDSFEDMPNGLKAAELISRIRSADGGIDYEAAELFIGKKLKGNETIDELIKMVITEKKADGGRVGLFMGGPALTGEALSIYNSMNAYGFSDQEIADALRARGLYDAAPAVETPVTNTAPNIINQGGGDRDNPPPPKDPYAGLGYSSANFGLGQGINKDAVMDYEADAYSIGRTPLGQLSRFGVGIIEALKNVPTPFNLVRKGIEFAKQKELEKQRQEEAAARDLAREIQQQNIANRTGGYQFGYSPSSDFMSGGNQGKGGFANTEAGIGAASAAMGSSKDGGLMGYGGKSGTPRGVATMFTRRR